MDQIHPSGGDTGFSGSDSMIDSTAWTSMQSEPGAFSATPGADASLSPGIPEDGSGLTNSLDLGLHDLYDPNSGLAPGYDAAQSFADHDSPVADLPGTLPDHGGTTLHEPLLGDYYGYPNKAAYDEAWKNYNEEQKVWNESW
jgi:hypothetical protein